MTQTDQPNVPKLRFPGFEDGWSRKKVGQVAKLQGGYAFKSENFQTVGVPVVRISNISAKTGIVDLTGAAHHPEISINSKFTVADGDILIALSGATTGKACVFRSEHKAYLNQRVGLLRLVDNRNSYQFLQTRIFSKDFEDQLDRVLVAGAQPNIAPKDIEDFSFGFPTLPEQRKIASFLGAVDTKIAQLSRKKALLEDYKKSCMRQLFSQKIRFKDDDGNDFPDWEEKQLWEIFSEIADGGTPSKSNDAFFGGNIPWVVIEDIQPRIYKTKNTLTPEGLASSSAKLWPAGSVILSTGATIGRVGIADVPLATKQGICGIVPSDGVNNVWIYFLLQTLAPKFERLAQGNTIKEVRAPTIKKIVINLPHPAEQRKVADFLSAVDRKIDLVGQELSHARMFKQGLLQKMFV